MDMGTFQKIVEKLSMDEPKQGSRVGASVAVILDGKVDPRLLLIRRAERAGDPWSGQVAFPGGKSQEGDKTLKGTAQREALEEVGLDLGRGSEFLGYFGSFTTHTGTMEVVPSVFLTEDPAEVKTNGEVASYRWLNLAELISPEARSVYRFEFRGNPVEMPAFKMNDYVVWGLTHRILTALVA
jgi:8-oxo-dGTP pyrophosphatase MutT (NUDIX family)